MNIILVISDTLRRDHLPCYGNTAVQAPNLDALAAKSFVFDHCYRASFPTVPTHADLITGRNTFTYLPWGPLPSDEVTLAQCLKRAGYLTVAVGDTPFLLRNAYGYDRGFDDFLMVRGQRTGPEYEDTRRQRLSEQDYCARKHSRRPPSGWNAMRKRNSSCTWTPGTRTSRGIPPGIMRAPIIRTTTARSSSHPIGIGARPVTPSSNLKLPTLAIAAKSAWSTAGSAFLQNKWGPRACCPIRP